MSVQILSETEVRIAGRKFLYKSSNLYTIRDRESDADYDEDEEWMFENWCGPQVHELPILQQWITHLCTATPTTPTTPPTTSSPVSPVTEEKEIPNEKKTERWVGDWVITWTSVGSSGSMMCTRGNSLWIAEYSETDLEAKAAADGFLATPSEFVDFIHAGTKGDAYEPIVETLPDRSLKIEIAYIACKEYDALGWFILKPVAVPASVFMALKATLPAKPAVVLQQAIPDSPETVVLDEDDAFEEPEHLVIGAPTTVAPAAAKGVFRFRGAK